MLSGSNPEWKNNPFLRDAFKEAKKTPEAFAVFPSQQSTFSSLFFYDATWAPAPGSWPAAQSGRASVPGKRRRAIVIHQHDLQGQPPVQINAIKALSCIYLLDNSSNPIRRADRRLVARCLARQGIAVFLAGREGFLGLFFYCLI